MKKIVCLAFILAFLTLACSKSPEEQVLDYLLKANDIVNNNQDDCAVLAKKLNEHADKNGNKLGDAVSAMLKEANNDAEAFSAKLEEMSEKSKPETKDQSKCENDEAVQKAQEKVFEPMLKPLMEAVMKSMGDKIPEIPEAAAE